MSLTPFTIPLTPLDPNRAPMQIRSALNQLVAAVNASSVQANGPTTVTGPSPTVILPAKTGQVWALVSGRQAFGANQTFVDNLAYDPVHGTAVTVLSGTNTGTIASAARTYALNSGALTLIMAASTYNVTVYPSVLS